MVESKNRSQVECLFINTALLLLCVCYTQKTNNNYSFKQIPHLHFTCLKKTLAVVDKLIVCSLIKSLFIYQKQIEWIALNRSSNTGDVVFDKADRFVVRLLEVFVRQAEFEVGGFTRLLFQKWKTERDRSQRQQSCEEKEGLDSLAALMQTAGLKPFTREI